MTVSNSVLNKLPLDVESDPHCVVTQLPSPSIPWQYNEEAATHDWSGYIRIPEDGSYTFTATIDDQGSIVVNGTTVVSLTGDNSATNVTGTTLTLEAGYYTIQLHHVNNAIQDYPNAEQFSPMINGSPIEIYEIKVPTNLWTQTKANSLLSAYSSVNYNNAEQSDIWEMFGEAAVASHGDKETCATRVSIALNRIGYRLTGATNGDGSNASNNVELMGWDTSVLNGGKHVITSADAMSRYLRSNIMQTDAQFTDASYDEIEGDILIFGDSLHVGICPGDDSSVGSFLSGSVWVLYRPYWNPAS